MIKLQYKTGNLLNVTSGHIIHGCNAVGKFASGVAGSVREKYPDVYNAYMYAHERKELRLGTVHPVVVSNSLILWNAITQVYYGKDGKRYVSYDAVQVAFQDIDSKVKELAADDTIVPIMHIPLIGAGLSGGTWEIIATIIEHTVNHETIVWKL